jgi:hypothetical protein
MGTLAILVYYLLFSAGRTLAENASVSPGIALWMPNMLFGTLAVVLLVRTAREKPSVLLVRLNAIVDLVHRQLSRLLGGRV